MANFVKVSKASDVKVNSSTVVQVNGTEVALFNLDGTFYAIDNTCVHRGGPLGEGACEGDLVVCPWHGWEYEIKTGKCVTNPSAQVATYPVKVEGDDVLVGV